MINLPDIKNRQKLIDNFPEYFQEYLADPTFADICQKDPQLISSCLGSFEEELKDRLLEAREKAVFSKDSTIEYIKKHTGKLHAFLYFLQSKFSGKFLDTSIVLFFESKISAFKENNSEASGANLAILYAVALAKNPTVDIGLVRRIEIAIFDESSDRFTLLKETIKARLGRGY